MDTNTELTQTNERAVLAPEFHLLPDELAFLRTLPDLHQDVKFSAPDKRRIDAIFYRLFTMGELGKKLLEIDAREKWPAGPRVKSVESKAIILLKLAELNNFTGLHESVTLSYLLPLLRDGRASIVYLLPRVLTVVE